jgi:hypothetical protein
MSYRIQDTNQSVKMNCAAKKQPPSPPSLKHNLNIQSYSLDELLAIFDLDYYMTIEDLKRAKKKVLMLHPDKSKLHADYFLFYKKAFDVVCQFYENQNKQNADISSKNTLYIPIKAPTSAEKQVSTVIEKMGEKGFQDKFNELFEKNMSKKPNEEKNAWFKTDEPAYQIDAKINTKNMGEALEHIKQKKQPQQKNKNPLRFTVSGLVGNSIN